MHSEIESPAHDMRQRKTTGKESCLLLTVTCSVLLRSSEGGRVFDSSITRNAMSAAWVSHGTFCRRKDRPLPGARFPIKPSPDVAARSHKTLGKATSRETQMLTSWRIRWQTGILQCSNRTTVFWQRWQIYGRRSIPFALATSYEFGKRVNCFQLPIGMFMSYTQPSNIIERGWLCE